MPPSVTPAAFAAPPAPAVLHGPPGGPAPPSDVARALAYVRAHLTDPGLGAAVVQDVLGLGASGFRTRFRVHVGRPLGDHIEAERMTLAAGHLAGGALVGDVAFAVGYRSHETFTRAFARATGRTPSAYRAEYASKNVKT